MLIRKSFSGNSIHLINLIPYSNKIKQKNAKNQQFTHCELYSMLFKNLHCVCRVKYFFRAISFIISTFLWFLFVCFNSNNNFHRNLQRKWNNLQISFFSVLKWLFNIWRVILLFLCAFFFFFFFVWWIPSFDRSINERAHKRYSMKVVNWHQYIKNFRFNVNYADITLKLINHHKIHTI